MNAPLPEGWQEVGYIEDDDLGAFGTWPKPDPPVGDAGESPVRCTLMVNGRPVAADEVVWLWDGGHKIVKRGHGG